MTHLWLTAVLPAVAADETRSAVVASVYDGDTMTLVGGDKVRLRYVNTPELKAMEPWAAEARDFTRALAVGREVVLHVPPDGRDAYGRLVASVEIDGVDLATEVVRAGLGHVFLVPPEMPDASALFAAQHEARAAQRGLWSGGSALGVLHLTSFHANGAGPDGQDPNVEYFRLANLTESAFDLTGWRVADPLGRQFSLPHVELAPGAAVAVHSGVGVDAPDQGHLYLGSPLALWPDEGATLLLLAPDGRVVDRRTP